MVRPAAWLLGGAMITVAAAWAWFRGRVRWRAGWIVPLLLLLAAVVMAFVAGVSSAPPTPVVRLAFAFEAAALAAVMIGVVVRQYRSRRSNVVAVATRWGVVVAGVLITLLVWHGGTVQGIRTAVFRTAELVYLSLSATWLVFFGAAWVAFLAGLVVRRAARGNERVASAEWTARLTLALPAASLMILTTLLWYVFAYASAQTMACWRYEPTGWLTWVNPDVAVACAGARPGEPGVVASEFLLAMVADGAALGFAPLIAMAAVAFAMVAYAIGPVAITEIFPRRRRADGTLTGVWLDAGFRLARRAGELIVFGMLIVLPAGMALLFVTPDRWAGPTHVVLAAAAGFLVPAATGLLVFGGRLKSLALGFRSLLDVLLDVDNYLREQPRASTPRARICTRFASLLRHVYAGDYQAVVIIAHSQGTVIAADLLRFIKAARLDQTDAGLARRDGRDIYLFTMGSPLRQLYGLRFPHLYRWARHDVTARWSDPATPIAADTEPNPAALGVTEWVNAYRAGDYVGRYLWRPDDCEFRYRAEPARIDQPWRLDRPLPVVESRTADPVTRREFCLGDGAHTHYWDKHAPEIARELDRLICRSPSGSSRS